MRTTNDYFNMSNEELQKVANEYGYTKEECLLFDGSENTRIFESLENLENSKPWYIGQGYGIGEILQMTTNQYALFLY